VVVDEVALPVGRFRVRARGSAGGHNGLKSIEGAVGSQEYARLRLGVGPIREQQERGDLSDYVLDRFGKEEASVVTGLLPTMVELVDHWISEGALAAMNAFNRRAARAPSDDAENRQEPDAEG
jgi:PTH1 family peptidyl-tRNA hydrolase